MGDPFAAIISTFNQESTVENLSEILRQYPHYVAKHSEIIAERLVYEMRRIPIDPISNFITDEDYVPKLKLLFERGLNPNTIIHAEPFFLFFIIDKLPQCLALSLSFGAHMKAELLLITNEMSSAMRSVVNSYHGPKVIIPNLHTEGFIPNNLYVALYTSFLQTGPDSQRIFAELVTRIGSGLIANNTELIAIETVYRMRSDQNVDIDNLTGEYDRDKATKLRVLLNNGFDPNVWAADEFVDDRLPGGHDVNESMATFFFMRYYYHCLAVLLQYNPELTEDEEWAIEYMDQNTYNLEAILASI